MLGGKGWEILCAVSKLCVKPPVISACETVDSGKCPGCDGKEEEEVPE